MADLKPFEVIMRFYPIAGQNGKGEVCMKAERVSKLVRCKDCKYGEQDDVGRWFCSDLGCQIGNEDGSGYCANAERRTDE